MYWQWHDEANVMDISCSDANNDVYCLQGMLAENYFN